MDSVVCLWAYKNAGSRKVWKLVESYRIDDTCHAVTPTIFGAGSRHPYSCFLTKEDEEGGYDDEPGRLVTIWHPSNGVSLYGFNPPSFCEWLNSYPITQAKNWFQFIQGGWELIEGTVEQVQKLLALGESR